MASKVKFKLLCFKYCRRIMMYKLLFRDFTAVVSCIFSCTKLSNNLCRRQSSDRTERTWTRCLTTSYKLHIIHFRTQKYILFMMELTTHRTGYPDKAPDHVGYNTCDWRCWIDDYVDLGELVVRNGLLYT